MPTPAHRRTLILLLSPLLALRASGQGPSRSEVGPVTSIAISRSGGPLGRARRIVVSPAERAARLALQDTLVALERAAGVAWQRRDGAFFERLLSDDHVDIHPTGVAYKSAVVAGVYSPACVVQRYSADHFRVVLFDANTALVTYRAEQTTTCNGVPVPSPAWIGSLYLRRDGEWRNAVFQSSPVPKP
jgi:hypothetical protein